MNSVTLAEKELKSFGYTPKLLRSLNIWQISLFGLTYLQPIGPAVIFGYLLMQSHGTVALPYLFAFLAMLFTIASYSILIKEYPLSGSIYSYVKHVIGSYWGFIAGWLLALDYILIPTITSICAAIFAHNLFPFISYEIWLIGFIGSMGLLNIIGIKCTSFVSTLFLLVQIIIVFVGFIFWIFFINLHQLPLISLRPFSFSSLTSIIQASSLAVFSFLGFDAVTTLAEEAVEPKRDIPRAMIVCSVIGFGIMFITGYLGVLTIPNWDKLLNEPIWLNGTLFQITKMTGGNTFSYLYTCGFIIAMVTSNLVGTTAVSRLLFGMGRDNAISKRIFATVNERWKTPHINIIIIMIIELILGSLFNQEQIAELINFGAVSGFTILNFSAAVFGYRKLKTELEHLKIKSQICTIVTSLIVPLIGFAIMLAIFINMNPVTLSAGLIWGLGGTLYYYLSPRKFLT